MTCDQCSADGTRSGVKRQAKAQRHYGRNEVDGVHDLGGKHGFGAVNVALEDTAGRSLFHARWHACVFAMMRALGGIAIRNTDQFRHAVERIDPVAYLSHGYYGRWLGGIETLAVEAGVVSTEEITARAVALGADARDRIAARPMHMRPTRMPELSSTSVARRELATSPSFVVGDLVRTRRDVLPHHTRLPTYARSRAGRVTAYRGAWVFPDTNAMGDGERPQHLYTVAFAGEELWGAGTEPGITVHLDLFEPYLVAELPLAEQR